MVRTLKVLENRKNSSVLKLSNLNDLKSNKKIKKYDL